jgi:hypothetical protein
MGYMVRRLNPGRRNKLFSSLKPPTPAVGPRLPSIKKVLRFVPGVRTSGLKFNHSPSSNAEVNSKMSYVFTFPICLPDVDRDKYAF